MSAVPSPVFKGTDIIKTELRMQPQAGSPVQLAPPKGLALIKGINIEAVPASGC